MNPPESLAAKMFLLAFDPRKQRLTARDDLGYLLRAAALAELVLNGRLRDEDGKAVAAGPALAGDPVLDEQWSRIEAAGPRSWRRWVGHDRRQIFAAVRDQLAEAHVIKTEQVRILGLFPYTRVTLRDTRAARRVAEQVSRAVRGGQAAGRVDRDAGVLAALAAAGQLRVVLGGRERRQFKTRLDRLGEPVEPVAKALRRAITSKRAAAASGG
ncbi:GOLPH3/VPS74 family protein [Amycolatopsis alkalitolerans]|uniref:GPP34 family phosphoprotein n=1 Tax=Amycolatopsis alkalitolerans TaxID=2547244 RepID=A0A5C4M385_9PSEU|nr:GPP34 family phosphoprotein [Amycolatopsis alkalitolerans]TNC25458.1 GPP34 family phosphoprotein [Amycolatopsis alkalitolerans]